MGKMVLHSSDQLSEQSQLKTDGNVMNLESSVNHKDSSKEEETQPSQKVTKSGAKGTGKPVKRKRASSYGNVLSTNKEYMVAEYRREMDQLFEYYKELSGQSLNFDGESSTNNSLIACLLEESNLSFSKLVETIYEKLKEKEGVSLAFARSAILSIGQRMMYGITNTEADVLEDESVPCLWCWETRDMKLLPANQRGDINARRVGRKKIQERISALLAALSALETPESQDNHKSNLSSAFMKLGKTPNLEDIRSLVEKKKQKSDTASAEKAAKLKEKESIREAQREKLQAEKEMKRLQDEAEKEAKRREKEEAELKKQLKKQQEEAEKDRRRRERAEAELKEQRSVKKQATIMERFLKVERNNNDSENIGKQLFTKDPECSPCEEQVVNATTSLIDNALSSQESLDLNDLRRLHADSWHKLSCCNRSCHWGVRRKPKAELFKELKLHESSIGLDPLGNAEIPTNDTNDVASVSGQFLRKKLLQFDKSNRPAYYGTWSKKSCDVGPRCPFKEDPDLDYDVDSDEEWEEEEPGESLSDCDKDTDEERAEEEKLKLDEEESEDDFFVPDGYLSENEGVQVDGKSDEIDESSARVELEVESEEIRAMLQHQKRLRNLSEQALRKNHPMLISNLMHEKSETKTVEDISGTFKIDQMCLQALSMQAYPGGGIIDLFVEDCPENKDQNKSNKTPSGPSPSTGAISDSDLPEFVSSILSNSQCISKVLESLQGKFPTTPKSQLRNKVKEISQYVDNHWQVKKEILDKLGLSTSPEKGLKLQGIASFFSKRCLPPEQESISASKSSHQQGSETTSTGF